MSACGQDVARRLRKNENTKAQPGGAAKERQAPQWRAQRRLIRRSSLPFALAMSKMAISTRTSVILLVTVGAVVAAISLLESSSYYEWQQKRMVRAVLAANPDELLRAGRMLLANRSGYVGEMSSSSRDIPPPIRRLQPKRVLLKSDSVWVEFSDICNPFAFTVFTPAADASKTVGYGWHKWIDGLWIFDDGQLEKFGQPGGPANGSQPIRSETNRTSSAAGSRR
jgi:hypothetical protein